MQTALSFSRYWFGQRRRRTCGMQGCEDGSKKKKSE